MHPTRSLRFRLALTYAAMALLTAAILGGILLTVLSSYYARSEDAYLRAAAERIAADPPISAAKNDLAAWAQIAALSTQTRVRVIDAEGETVVDSGSPGDVDPRSIAGLGEDRGEHRGRGRLPSPLGEGIFGGTGDPNATPRSSRALKLAFASGRGYVEVSEAPASGRAALVSAAQAWTVAAALAVILAAFVGYALSRRISEPIVALTLTSDRMAEGELGARTDVTRDDEVGRLAASFNSMAGRIEATVVALRRFVADAAHEIGTPLTALQADLELAEQAATTEDERRLVGRALEQSRRLETLSGNLLRLSRIEAGESPDEPSLVDVAVLADEAADSVASRAEQAGVELTVQIAAGPFVVAAERSELQAVLSNLLDNAVKFTPEGGTVTLSVRPDAGFVLLSVADTGVGIPAAEQARVFDRFHRARNVAAYPGSGLGLPIVYAAVEHVGGSVEFDSSEAGSEFRVRLPLV